MRVASKSACDPVIMSLVSVASVTQLQETTMIQEMPQAKSLVATFRPEEIGALTMKFEEKFSGKETAEFSTNETILYTLWLAGAMASGLRRVR